MMSPGSPDSLGLTLYDGGEDLTRLSGKGEGCRSRGELCDVLSGWGNCEEETTTSGGSCSAGEGNLLTGGGRVVVVGGGGG